MTYLLLKLLHIAFVIIFFGSIYTGMFWAAQAFRSRDQQLISKTFEGITTSDRWLTIPGAIGLFVFGAITAVQANLSLLRTGWVLWSIVLLAISGIIFNISIAPLQRKIAQLAGNGSNNNWPELQVLYKRWKRSAHFAIAAPISALILMVLKPALPAF